MNLQITLGDLAIPIMADENSDNRQQEDSAVGDGGDKCGNVDDTNTASSSNSAMADGLSRLISSVMTAFDSRAEATGRSQDQLAFALDRLTGGVLLKISVLNCSIDEDFHLFALISDLNCAIEYSSTSNHKALIINGVSLWH